YRPAAVPAAAFDPLYSFWYSYHQGVNTANVEKECAAAVPYGMKTAIIDDGWQTDDNSGRYAYCGDWEVSTNRFADFAGHIKKVQEMGMKYMIWYSVPYVGFKSKNFAKFKGKYLYEDHGMLAAVLDPRFPEVREFLIGKYEQAVRDWGVDGLKLDFIDSFGFRGADPAVKEDYAGRDIKSLPEAIDRLMTDVNKRLAAIKPGVLIEFRQSYIGPAILKYGNMLRAADCPMDVLSNRIRTLDLRLSCGPAAVHSDMLMWNMDESPEAASKQFWNILFSVPQISVRLEEISAAHRAKLREMLDFWLAHRETIMKGELRPMRPDLNYPIVYAYGKDEQVVAVYDPAMVVEVDRSRGPIVYIVNATDAKTLVVREGKNVREVKVAPCSTLRLD
ncbi:MAG TPA: alpha-galactosidase, partial [Verrucomicrobia bacterium]|nr:alpha-galactosidase [Verrucomicrobiota bacterium]